MVKSKPPSQIRKTKEEHKPPSRKYGDGYVEDPKPAIMMLTTINKILQTNLQHPKTSSMAENFEWLIDITIIQESCNQFRNNIQQDKSHQLCGKT